MERLKGEIVDRQGRLAKVGQEKFDVVSKQRQAASSTDPVKQSLHQVCSLPQKEQDWQSRLVAPIHLDFCQTMRIDGQNLVEHQTRAQV